MDIKLLIEPINTFDIPGFYLFKTEQALDILKEVDSDNLYIQYDIYHAQRMEGELSKTLEKNISKIAHIQLADNPGRNEPGTGEINYAHLFKLIDRVGYQEWIGCDIDLLPILKLDQISKLNIVYLKTQGCSYARNISCILSRLSIIATFKQGSNDG
uniref:Hydroxypyruvate isomerase n=1 Tax=Polynucleobacter necessarius subsp. necessarius (strain STIR1) TaxID=452638 RepID=B1XUR3_POLNS